MERILERAAEDRSRPSQHTLVVGGSAAERARVFDRVEAGLKEKNTECAVRIGRVPKGRCADAAALWEQVAAAADLEDATDGETSALGRIERAGKSRLTVAIVEELDTTLAGWTDAGEALNLRWALQNVNGLMVIGGAESPISGTGPHEHSVLAMTFATQSI